ncbi:uncharacterized protein LOC121381470 [Gigantopelta aegis]|uniref:uncharacterized protein LOC121381470 n=1 Tax=Gigantopelta aegis TaxID=1735272 RepID=UPI001B88965B|nr:uncharacterized protein LOC121381470 [Gigantopelta aegis]
MKLQRLLKNNIEFVTIEDRKNHCHCELWEGKRCIGQFSQPEQDEIRMNIQEMTPFEKDLLLLGMVSMAINDSKMTDRSKKKTQTERALTRIRWFFMGHKRICRDTWIYLMETSRDTLTKIKRHYEENGLVPRVKKSGGRSNSKHALVLDDVRNVTRYILNFAADHAILLPGRIPGFKRYDIKVIPSNFNKTEVWRLYRAAATPDQRVVGCSTFRKLWARLTPYVVIARPASDLCWTCQKNNNLIAKCVNVDEQSKSEVLRKQEQHLHLAMMERFFTKPSAVMPKQQLQHTGFLGWNHVDQTQRTYTSTTPSIMHNRCTILPILSNLVQYTLRPLGNARCSVYMQKEYHVR